MALLKGVGSLRKYEHRLEQAGVAYWHNGACPLVLSVLTWPWPTGNSIVWHRLLVDASDPRAALPGGDGFSQAGHNTSLIAVARLKRSFMTRCSVCTLHYLTPNPMQLANWWLSLTTGRRNHRSRSQGKYDLMSLANWATVIKVNYLTISSISLLPKKEISQSYVTVLL